MLIPYETHMYIHLREVLTIHIPIISEGSGVFMDENRVIATAYI